MTSGPAPRTPVLRSEQSSGAAATDGIWNVVKDTGMSDPTWNSTIASAPDSKHEHEVQGTILPPTPTGTGTPVTPAPKRNHNRRPGSTCKGSDLTDLLYQVDC